jgi:hypothetical protein
MNTKILAGLIGIVLIGATFYGGMVYGKSTASARGQFRNGMMGGRFGGGGMRGMNGGFAAGEILSKDATSLTIKMPDGSTKIIVISQSVQVSKMAPGSLDDLTVGTNVLVTGTPNSDGSLTGQTIQIRPAGSPAYDSSTRQNQ